MTQSKQLDLELKALPEVSSTVKKIAVPISFASEKCTLIIRKNKLDKIINDDEQLLEMVQQKLRVNAETKLKAGQFDVECQSFAKFIKDHREETDVKSTVALQLLIKGKADEEEAGP